MYIDDIYIFAKNENDVEALIETIRIYNLDRGMGFRI